jgi:positive regulator of sigma E activity
MTRWHPKYLLVAAVFLLVLGFLLPFLMILQVIPSTFFLNFLAFTSSVIGLFVGFIGIAVYRGRRE